MKDITIRFLEVYKYFLNAKKVKDASDFAGKIGISTSMMTEIVKGRSNAGVATIQKTVKHFKLINLEWLMTGHGKMTELKMQAMPILNPDEEQAIKLSGIPLIEINAIAGNGSGFDFLVNLNEVEDRYVIPLFENKGVDFLTRVRGDSMYPKYNNSDIVACKFVTDRIFIQWGKVYVIDTISQGLLIKRLFEKDEKYIICRSENKSYPDFNVPLEDVRSMSLVIGSVSLE